MEVKDYMKRNVVSIPDSATIGEAAALFVGRHVGTLPVVDPAGRLVGVLQMRDLLALVMPDFVRLIEDFDFVPDFGALESRLPSSAAVAHPVREVMEPPLSVDEHCGLLRAFALLRQHELYDLPVVAGEAKVLVGIASRVDIGAALLAGWQAAPAPGTAA